MALRRYWTSACILPADHLVTAVGMLLARRLELTELLVKRCRNVPDSGDSFGACREEWLGSGHTVTQNLRRGIAVHHGRLPDAVRTAIEADYRDGDTEANSDNHPSPKA